MSYQNTNTGASWPKKADKTPTKATVKPVLMPAPTVAAAVLMLQVERFLKASEREGRADS